MNTQEIYNDPIIFRKRSGNQYQPYEPITEAVFVERNYAQLREVPNRYERVQIISGDTRFYEVQEGELQSNTYRVDYVNGLVQFHPSVNGQTLTFKYLGEGVTLFPDTRIYMTDNAMGGTLRDKFRDLDRADIELNSRIDNLITSTPQPDEVVDLRVDRNGQVFATARARVNSEQQKVEEAYIDTNNVNHGSLKARIDSLQLASEYKYDDLNGRMVDVWAEIELIPGKISLEVGEVTEGLESRIAAIELLPDEINLRLEGVDNRLSQLELLPDQINAFVRHDDLISSINLSPGEIKIQSDKISLVGAVTVLSDIADDLGIINAGVLNSAEINTALINGENSAIYFGSTDENNFDGRIDYVGGAIRLQKDRYTYYMVRGLGDDVVGANARNAHSMYVEGQRMFTFGYDTNEGYNHRIISSGNVSLKFLNGYTLALQARNATDDSYIDIHAADFVTRSGRESKTNINEYSTRIIDKALEIPIYTYMRKSSSVSALQDRYHLGFMKDEMPSLLQRAEGIDLLATSAYILKALQEHVIESRNEIAKLKQEIKLLKSK